MTHEEIREIKKMVDLNHRGRYIESFVDSLLYHTRVLEKIYLFLLIPLIVYILSLAMIDTISSL